MDLQKMRKALHTEILMFMAENKEFDAVTKEIFSQEPSYTSFIRLLTAKGMDDIQTETLKKRIWNHIQIEAIVG